MTKEEQNVFLSEINRFYLEARYPDYKSSLQDLANENFTRDYLSKIKETIEWIKSQMK